MSKGQLGNNLLYLLSEKNLSNGHSLNLMLNIFAGKMNQLCMI